MLFPSTVYRTRVILFPSNTVNIGLLLTLLNESVGSFYFSVLHLILGGSPMALQLFLGQILPSTITFRHTTVGKTPLEE